ncbi:MAG: uL15 family ribosomal protein, partial [Desulfobulbaceae bacterium]|nr:uL15 family ribosomal protein [Desulfobulbaceae bacterium]
FTNPFKKEYALVSLSDLNCFDNGSTVNKETLLQAGLINPCDGLVKILANGEVTVAVTVEVDKISASAKEKITAAGGSIKE